MYEVKNNSKAMTHINTADGLSFELAPGKSVVLPDHHMDQVKKVAHDFDLEIKHTDKEATKDLVVKKSESEIIADHAKAAFMYGNSKSKRKGTELDDYKYSPARLGMMSDKEKLALIENEEKVDPSKDNTDVAALVSSLTPEGKKKYDMRFMKEEDKKKVDTKPAKVDDKLVEAHNDQVAKVAAEKKPDTEKAAEASATAVKK